MNIKLSGYAKFLAEIRNHLKQGQEKIINTVTRQKVVTSWQIGKAINSHLQKNNRADYGEKLIDQLSEDTAISRSALYQMRSFYQTYPKLPADNEKLNWSHYQALSGVKSADKRKYFESLAQQKNLDVRTLELEIKKVGSDENSTQKKGGRKVSVAKKIRAKITPQRGKLFSYQVTKLGDSEKNYLDLGFKIFTETTGISTGTAPGTAGVSPADNAQSRMDAGTTRRAPTKSGADSTIVDVTKSGKKYSYKKSTTPANKIHTYKAQLERVVDGDTIHVILDLGFGIKHREIIRLAKINAAESGTEEGKKASDELKKILHNVPLLILKTFSTDIYGRYIADVFFDERKNKNADPQKIAEEGIYLNQLLLNKNLVEIY